MIESLLFYAYSFLLTTSIPSIHPNPTVKFGIWGVDKIGSSKEHQLLCQFKKDNFDFIQSYSSFKAHSIKRLESLLKNTQDCRISLILAIQPFRKNILADPTFNAKLQLLSLYPSTVIAQIADEPRSKNQITFIPGICRHIQKYSIPVHLQEGVNPTILPCVTQNGLHSHRRNSNINPSLKIIARNSTKLRNNNKDMVYTMRMFNSTNQNKFVDINYFDAESELCYVLKSIKPDKIAFYTYNKRRNGEGMMQNQELYNIASRLVLNYKNNRLSCSK